MTWRSRRRALSRRRAPCRRLFSVRGRELEFIDDLGEDGQIIVVGERAVAGRQRFAYVCIRVLLRRNPGGGLCVWRHAVTTQQRVGLIEQIISALEFRVGVRVQGRPVFHSATLSSASKGFKARPRSR